MNDYLCLVYKGELRDLLIFLNNVNRGWLNNRHVDICLSICVVTIHPNRWVFFPLCMCA